MILAVLYSLTVLLGGTAISLFPVYFFMDLVLSSLSNIPPTLAVRTSCFLNDA